MGRKLSFKLTQIPWKHHSKENTYGQDMKEEMNPITLFSSPCMKELLALSCDPLFLKSKRIHFLFSARKRPNDSK